VAETRLVSIIGRKNSGKTTLVTALAADYHRRKKRCATIKHSCHHPSIDREGTDTWRHFNEGMATQVVYETAGQRVIFKRQKEEGDPVSITRQYLMDNDLVIVEGFKGLDLPKIEVYRSVLDEPPLFEPGRPDAANWIALVTDQEDLQLPIPVFRYQDTAWMMTLSNVMWQKALVVTT
jgi:molybdopterin-guanine dinucleotide biosynthesis protein B